MENVFMRYLNSELDDRVLVSPLINMYVTSSLLHKEWLSDVTFDDVIKANEMCGIDPMYHPKESTLVFDEQHPLGWKTKVKQVNENERIYEGILHTRLGNLRRLIKEIKGQSYMEIESPIKDESDYEKLISWLKEARKEADYFTYLYKGYKSKVGNKGLLRFEIPLPFEGMWWMPRHDPIFHALDWPNTFTRFEGEAMETILALIETAVKGGANLIFFGSVGTELYSEKVITEHVLEDAICVAKFIKKQGVLSIFHCCGYAKVWIDTGFLNNVNPDIYESLSEPPVGEIEDLREYRKKINKTICTRGNIDLGILHDGAVDDVEFQVKKTLDEMKGYKHIIAGTCAITIGTPLENLQSLVSTTEKLGKHFR